MPALRPTDQAALIGVAHPQAADNAAVSTGWADLTLMGSAMVIVSLGATDVIVSSIKIREAKSSAGGSAQDLAGKAATNLAATDDNKQVVFNIDASELSAGYTHIQATATAADGTTGALLCIVVLGLHPRFAPASDHNLTSVAQIV